MVLVSKIEYEDFDPQEENEFLLEMTNEEVFAYMKESETLDMLLSNDKHFWIDENGNNKFEQLNEVK